MSPAAEDPNPQFALRHRLLGLVEKVLDRPGAGPSLTPDAALSELGVSSLKVVSLMLSVEVEFRSQHSAERDHTGELPLDQFG
jgi:acyl carrier protein